MLGFQHKSTERSKLKVKIKMMSPCHSVQMSTQRWIPLWFMYWRKTLPNRYIKIKFDVGYFQWLVSRRLKSHLLFASTKKCSRLSWVFTQSELIEPVCTQAAQLGINFIIFLSQHTVRDLLLLRDLIKNAPLLKESRKRWRRNQKKNEKKKKPRSWPDLNPWPQEFCSACVCSSAVPQLS